MSYTFATLPISSEAYEEIKQRLLNAGATYAIYKTGLTEEVLDMKGIALVAETEKDKLQVCVLCGKETEPNVMGQLICINCARLPIEEEIQPKEELSRRDKNYYLSKENK